MDISDKSSLINHLLQYVTENKAEKMQEVLKNRTRYITVVLEDLFQEHNASAAWRARCECGASTVSI